MLGRLALFVSLIWRKDIDGSLIGFSRAWKIADGFYRLPPAEFLKLLKEGANMSDDREMPAMQCPQCGRWEPDYDGFGMLAHLYPAYQHGCGYCSHPNRTDGVCGMCGHRAAVENER